MRQRLFIALLAAAGCSALANSSATFTGGSGDGSAHAEYLLPKQPSLAFHFLGGSRDGYASGGWQSYRRSALPAIARFAGSVRDGYASSRFLSSWSQNSPRRFLGGSFDGYDRLVALGIPNWTTGDTDGNGLPDWWELKYFAVLIGTDPNGDADRDGASNLYEYLSGTTPTNAVSYFHITRVTPGLTNRVFVYCTPAFYYTLEHSTNLSLGWANVTNQIRISPASEGVLEMDDHFNGSRGFYRVLLEH